MIGLGPEHRPRPEQSHLIVFHCDAVIYHLPLPRDPATCLTLRPHHDTLAAVPTPMPFNPFHRPFVDREVADEVSAPFPPFPEFYPQCARNAQPLLLAFPNQSIGLHFKTVSRPQDHPPTHAETIPLVLEDQALRRQCRCDFILAEYNLDSPLGAHLLRFGIFA